MSNVKLIIGIIWILVHQALSSQVPSGRDDFDFYVGRWQVSNRRLMEDGKWIAFSAKVEARKTLNGLANVDFFEALVNGEPYAGMTVRLFDRSTNEWSIKWYDTDTIEEPMPSVGKFENGLGKFYKTIIVESGTKVIVRFLWYDISEDSFNWEASWSVDNQNWNPTWLMAFKRDDG